MYVTDSTVCDITKRSSQDVTVLGLYSSTLSGGTHEPSRQRRWITPYVWIYTARPPANSLSHGRFHTLADRKWQEELSDVSESTTDDPYSLNGAPVPFPVAHANAASMLE